MHELITGDAFDALFSSFQRSAFRLEGRDRYYAPDEQERVKRFLAGQGYDVASRLASPWWQTIRQATIDGKVVRRVRVVTEPHGEYTRYALVGARINIDGGEDIRYLPRHQAVELGLPEHDYWLFDERLVVLMHFDDADAFVGAELVDDPATVAEHRRWQATAWEHSIPYDRYVL
ncbi:DUF6879 family protein [Nonomuraea rubra]